MKRTFVFAAWLSLAAGGVAGAQTASPTVSLPGTEYREFTSTINGRGYAVFVALPDDYLKNATKRYSVVYLTDANLFFGAVTQVYRLLRLNNEIPELILVGISVSDLSAWQAARTLDLTPTRVVSRDEATKTRSGGGSEFLRVMTEELIPQIEERYRTLPDRTYLGASFGGLFGAYALLHTPNTFQRMLLVSPSLSWDGGVTFKDEERYSVDHKSLRAHVFLSAGELEGGDMLGDMRRFANTLSRRHYEGLTIRSRIFEGETHYSTLGVAVTRGLKVLFAGSDSTASSP